VEAHDDRAGRAREQHVGFGNRAHAAMHDFDLDLRRGELRQRVRERFGGTALSALMMIRSVATPPAAASAMKSSSVLTRPERRCCASRSRRCRFLRDVARLRSVVHRQETVPASGTPSKPRICTGVDGPTSVSVPPRSSYIARTRPEYWPQMKSSPMCSVPFWTRIVARAPLPGSSCASSTVPCALRSGFA